MANKPWTQSTRNAEWVRLYREEGLSFHAIAKRAGAPVTAVRETVISFFARGGYRNWRHCHGC